MPLYRVKAAWNGFTGAPGYSIFHFDAATEPTQAGAQNCIDAVDAFFDTMTAYMPTGVTVGVESTVELINAPDGQLVDVISGTAPLTNNGITTGPYSSAVGACVTWQSNGIRNGRRVRGRTFLVPLAPSTCFEGNGTLSNGFQSAMNTAATTLRDSTAQLQVFSRPSAPGASDGDFYTVVGHRIVDKTAVLRSRRD